MRGKDALQIVGVRDQGITPARAGKSYLSQLVRAARGDHPRACGEKQAMSYQRSPWEGITPARAGKSYVIAVFDFL